MRSAVHVSSSGSSLGLPQQSPANVGAKVVTAVLYGGSFVEHTIHRQFALSDPACCLVFQEQTGLRHINVGDVVSYFIGQP